jgi:hypothetical protein
MAPGSSAASVGSAKTIFLHDDLGWLSRPGEVSFVKSAIADNGGHYFLTGDGYPKQGTSAMGVSTRRLGVPKPSGALSVQFTGDPGDSVSRSSSYYYTYVVGMGSGGDQESAPSSPTGVFDVLDGQSVLLTGFDSPSILGVSAKAYRLYRTVPGFSSSSFFFVAEIAGGASSWTDDTSDAEISTETLATDGWDMPGDDASGMILTPNGIYAMHRENEILLSEPFIPYAYPDKYRMTTQDNIVGLGFLDSAIVALTVGRPVILSGSTPESMSMQPLAFEQSCVSKRSVVSTPYGVMYASPDGLCLISSAGPKVVTRHVFTKSQWRDLCPEAIIGACHEDKYYAFFAGSSSGFIYDFSSEDVVMLELGGPVYAAFLDVRSDSLFVNVGGSVRPFNSGTSPLTMRWRSAEFFTSVLVLPAVLRVSWDMSQPGPVTVRMYAHEQLRHIVAVSSVDPVRLPIVGRAENCWTLEIESAAAVYDVRVSSSIEELGHGV